MQNKLLELKKVIHLLNDDIFIRVLRGIVYFKVIKNFDINKINLGIILNNECERRDIDCHKIVTELILKITGK